ncbi:glycosyltransferase [Clostridium hydrogenum]|uniref:glycosyltransferase n=1 Tax=Clostridium hydrogenum TaxID=2855764 RepID=UPI001F32F79A|nr:glycosyltransferase [Clostridium hydrogenum]
MNKFNLSVLMCTYNSEKYISETIESILNQTFGEFEFIIVDDGSTDDTEKIIKRFKDARIKYYKLEKNVGIGKASNYGLMKTSSKYIARVDSDDIYDITRFQKQKNFLDKNNDFCIVGSLIDYFCENSNNERYMYCKNYIEKQTNSVLTQEDMHEKLYWYCCLVNSSIMGRSEVIKKYGYGDFRIGEDYKLFYELNKSGHKIINFNEILCRIRISDKSICAASDLEVYKILYEIKKEEIKNLFELDNRKVYIWGAGGLGKSLCQVFKDNGFQIDGFVDGMKEKWNTVICDKVVKSPYEIINEYKKVKVVVASEPGRFAITDYLKSKGYDNLIDYIVF